MEMAFRVRVSGVVKSKYYNLPYFLVNRLKNNSIKKKAIGGINETCSIL